MVEIETITLFIGVVYVIFFLKNIAQKEVYNPRNIKCRLLFEGTLILLFGTTAVFFHKIGILLVCNILGGVIGAFGALANISALKEINNDVIWIEIEITGVDDAESEINADEEKRKKD